MDFPDRGRSLVRLCNCGAEITGGTFCNTCYNNRSLGDRFKQSRRDWQQRRTWGRAEARRDSGGR